MLIGHRALGGCDDTDPGRSAPARWRERDRHPWMVIAGQMLAYGLGEVRDLPGREHGAVHRGGDQASLADEERSDGSVEAGLSGTKDRTSEEGDPFCVIHGEMSINVGTLRRRPRWFGR